MTETTTQAPVAAPTAPKAAAKKTAPKKAAPKKAAPKKGTKSAKAAPKKAAAKKATASGERGPSKTQIEVLKLLDKKGEMTRAGISEALDGSFIGGNIMGHVDPSKLHPNSLLARKLVSIATYPNKETGAEGPAHYSITAAGKKLLNDLKK